MSLRAEMANFCWWFTEAEQLLNEEFFKDIWASCPFTIPGWDLL